MAETIPKKTKADIKALVFMKQLIVYAKNYQADLERKDTKIENYRFYNEREWRYTLEYHNRKKVSAVFGENKADKTSLNESIVDARVGFDVDEITYITVETLEEIEITINAIRNAYNDRCTSKQLDILLSKIISVEQIRSDF
jgi:hypothetical protein